MKAFVTGDAISSVIISKAKSMILPGMRAIVIEDSSHTDENTLSVSNDYCGFVSDGSYFIVEDGICRYPYIKGPKSGLF